MAGCEAMKAITLWNPWAYFVWLAGHPDPEIAKLGKRIETRSWYTSYRGPLAIHSAKIGPAVGEELCEADPHFRAALKAAGIEFTGDIPLKALMPCGAVLCTCRMVDCLWIGNTHLREYYNRQKHGIKAPLPTGNELAFGDYTPGRYAWILEDIKQLPEPVPARGRQGLWGWEPEVQHG